VQDAEPGAIQRFPAIPQAVPVQHFPGSSLHVGPAAGSLHLQQPTRSRGWLLVAGMALGIVIVGSVAWALIGLRGTTTTGITQTVPKGDPDKFSNSIGMQMVRIPSGKFWMGSPENEVARSPQEGPPHEVVLTKPFYIGAHSVTVGQFRAFVKATKYKTEAETNRQGAGRYEIALDKFILNQQYTWENPGWALEDDQPVVCVNWNDARSFCAWLSEKEGRTYRLPTEAEWEYACRAGTTTPFSFGASLSSFQANFNGTKPYGEGARGPFREHPVKDIEAAAGGLFKPNAFGLYNMHGNGAQWTADLMGPYAAGTQTNPTGAAEGDRRVTRGGDWGHSADFCRSAARMSAKPTFACNVIGFRLVCEP
jgi:formylglycine-generating enzyme required for sulfatase activity